MRPQLGLAELSNPEEGAVWKPFEYDPRARALVPAMQGPSNPGATMTGSPEFDRRDAAAAPGADLAKGDIDASWKCVVAATRQALPSSICMDAAEAATESAVSSCGTAAPTAFSPRRGSLPST